MFLSFMALVWNIELITIDKYTRTILNTTELLLELLRLS
jgi:hypothetical protein